MKKEYNAALGRCIDTGNILDISHVPPRLSTDRDYANQDREILERIKSSVIDGQTSREIAYMILRRYSSAELEDHETPGLRLCSHASADPFWLKFASTPEARYELIKNISNAELLLENKALGYTPIIDWGPEGEAPFYLVMLHGRRIDKLLIEGSSNDIKAADELTDRLGEFMFSKGRVKQIPGEAIKYMDFVLHKLISRSEDLRGDIDDSEVKSRIAKLKVIGSAIPRLLHQNEAVCWGLDDALLSNFIYIPNGNGPTFERIKFIDQGYRPDKLDAWMNNTKYEGFDKLFKLPHFQLGRLNASISRILSSHISQRGRKRIMHVMQTFVSSGGWNFNDDRLKGKQADYWLRRHTNDDVLNIIFKLGEVSVFQNTEIHRNADGIERSGALIEDIIFRLEESGVIERRRY